MKKTGAGFQGPVNRENTIPGKEKQKVASTSKNSAIVFSNARALPVRVCSRTADDKMEPQEEFSTVPYPK